MAKKPKKLTEKRRPMVCMSPLVAFCPILTPSEKMVYLTILDHYNSVTKKCFPSIRRIAEKSGVTTRTVFRARNKLRTVGILTWALDRKIKQSNFYEFPLEHGSKAERAEAYAILQRVTKTHLVDGDKKAPSGECHKCTGGGDTDAPSSKPPKKRCQKQTRPGPVAKRDSDTGAPLTIEPYKINQKAIPSIEITPKTPGKTSVVLPESWATFPKQNDPDFKELSSQRRPGQKEGLCSSCGETKPLHRNTGLCWECYQNRRWNLLQKQKEALEKAEAETVH